MNPTEALYGFGAWLTCRPGTIKIGSAHNAAPMADLIKEWCDVNGLPEVTNDYSFNIKQPK